MDRISLSVLAALVALLAVTATASAASPTYDVAIWSGDFQPGSPVYINITGPANMSISVILTNQAGGNIVGGKDAQLDAYGKYTYTWTPNDEGTFNVTVTYSVGVKISRSFLIQTRVTQADLGRIWNAIYTGLAGLGQRIDALDPKINAAIGIGIFSFAFSGLMFNHVRRHYSRADSEFQKFMKQDVDTAVGRLLKASKGEGGEAGDADEE